MTGHRDRCPDCGALFPADDFGSVRCDACTRKDTTMSESMWNGPEGEREEPTDVTLYTYPVRDQWVRPFTPYDNIAAELASILHDITWVKCQANHKLDGPENHTLYEAWRKTSELLAALTAPASSV